MAGRETTVLCAGIVADGRESAGGVQKDVARVAEALAHAAQVSGGRVAARRERDAIALFPTPDAAASAARRLHAYALTLPPMAAGLGMRMGMHCGPLAQRGDAIAGPTIDFALELLAGAVAGEALISGHAIAGLSAGLQGFVAPSGPGGERGGRLLLGKLVVSNKAKLPSARTERVSLRLAYRSQSIVRRREGDAATIGSDAACDLAVADRGASQRHCTISQRRGGYLLRDHSANGTFITVEGGAEIAVRNAEFALSGRGFISFDRPGAGGDEVVRYICER